MFDPAPTPRGGQPYHLIRMGLRLALTGYCRPEIVGVGHVPAQGPVLLAANHLSFIDSVVPPLVVPRPVVFLAKAEYFTGTGVRGRLMAGFFRGINAVPVHRGGGRDETTEALATARAVLEGGGVFGIYPEGTRSRDGLLYRGRTGVAWLALHTGAPIVPVGLRGTERVQPTGTRLPRPRRFRIAFGTPIDPAPLAAKVAAGYGAGRARRELTDEVMAAIQRLSGQQAAGRYNAPPLTE